MIKTFDCSIGVMAYNEEANIKHLLDSLLNQRVVSCKISEIIIVASGCTDNTVSIVKSIVKDNHQVKLLVQERREGKASAIDLFLSVAKEDIVIIESGDTLPERDTIENLVRPFLDPNVGMTGARPIPVDSEDTFMGFTVNLFWELHHELALIDPKLGEMIAFRNIIRKFPKDTAVDEASIEAMITKAGHRIYYAKDAIVRNKGPETISDFIKQRRRIIAGHKYLQAESDYMVSTMKIGNLLHLFNRLRKDMSWNLKTLLWTGGAILLECWGRLLGEYDHFIKKTNPFVWDIAETTKNLKNDPTDS